MREKLNERIEFLKQADVAALDARARKRALAPSPLCSDTTTSTAALYLQRSNARHQAPGYRNVRWERYQAVRTRGALALGSCTASPSQIVDLFMLRAGPTQLTAGEVSALTASPDVCVAVCGRGGVEAVGSEMIVSMSVGPMGVCQLL